MIPSMPMQTEGVAPSLPLRAQICSFHYLAPLENLIKFSL